MKLDRYPTPYIKNLLKQIKGLSISPKTVKLLYKYIGEIIYNIGLAMIFWIWL